MYLANVGHIGRLDPRWAGSVVAAYAHFSVLDDAVRGAHPELPATPKAARQFCKACRRAENLRTALERLADGEDPNLVANDYKPYARTPYC